MNKKIKIGLFVFIIIGVVILNFMYKNEETKTKKKKQSNLAIMIKGDSGEYVNSDTIPKGNYVLNEEKTVCENGGKVVSYNNSTGQIGFSFLGSDRCSLYFDKIIDTQKPAISNLNVNGKNVTATLTDNEGLKAYGFSTSNIIEPTSWTTISGKTYNLSTTINTEGIYYLWVKDSAGNKEVSSKIDLEDRGWQTILANNTVHETTPDFSKVATTNEGLFKARDDLGDSYYFRGAVDNNWVKFGKDSSGKDIYWRIIRINGDGSIRMIYTGTTAPTESTKVVMTGTGTQINATKYKFNSSGDRAEHVGYMYTLGQQHGNSTSSTIKTTIENWYAGTTLKDNPLVSKDQIFCNDRSPSSTQTAAWTSTGANYYYGAYGRLDNNKKPILTCPTASDKFTVNTSNGNGALTYPVGLITADEVAMAGGVRGYSNSSYYLYTNQYYWSGSPYYFFSNVASAGGFDVDSSGYLGTYYVYDARGARPVISLSSKAKLIGDGTWNNVYEVEKGYETILLNNGNGASTVNDAITYIESKGTPDFSKVATTNEGLFKARDDLGDSYYFRGAVDNNWVKFGKDSSGKDIYWRIIRINGDGSIRMIYTGTTDPKNESSVTESNGVYMTGTGTQISEVAFNSSYDRAEYVGYMYTSRQQHGNSKSSTIKTTIDNWYKTTTLETDRATKNLVADQIFCNDRSPSSTQTAAWTSTGAEYYYGANGRLTQTTKNPILTCPTASDKFTVNTSNGNGALTYPVGLITADEIAMAGGVYISDNGSSNNQSYYLYTNQHYWSGSPSDIGSIEIAHEFYVFSSGHIYDDRLSNSQGTRVVVSLSSEAKLSGNGTYNDVYTVS